MLTIEQLRNPPTRTQVATWLKTTLTDLGLSTTGWQESRFQLQMLNAFATTVAGAGQLAASLVEMGFNSTATGAGLDIYSESRYSNKRDQSEETAGPFTFQNDSTTPYAVQPGEVIVTDDIGVQFVNTASGTVTAGATTLLEMEAVLAGNSGNIGNDSALSLVTPLAGVTVTNPSPGTGTEGQELDWYTTTGADQETNRELQQRNATQWGTLSIERTRTGVERLALEQAGVSKVFVDDQHPRGPYTVSVYVAGELAPTGSGDMALAQAAFAERTFHTSVDWPVPVLDPPSRYALFQTATLELDVQGTVFYDPQFTAEEVTLALNARLDAFAGSIPIGGFTYSPTVQNVVTIGDIYQIIEDTRGVVSLTMDVPAGNVAVPPTTLMTPPPSSQWVAVGKLELVKSDT